MRFLYILSSAIVFFQGYAQAFAIPRDDGLNWDDLSWTLSTSNLRQGAYQSRMSLANGYLGINVAALGPFFEVDEPASKNGWPLFNKRQTFATIAGFYNSGDQGKATNYPWLEQYGNESFLSGVPHWAGLLVEANGHLLNASTSAHKISNFMSSVDYKGGVMNWTYTWIPDDETFIEVGYEMFVHKLYVNQATVRLTLKASDNTKVTIHDIIEGTSAERTDFVDKKYVENQSVIWSAVSPRGVPGVMAYIVSTLVGGSLDTRSEVTESLLGPMHTASIGQSITLDLPLGKAVSVSKHIGAASSDAFDDPQSIAMAASVAGSLAEYRELRASHTKEWSSILTDDSVDRYHFPNGTLPDSLPIKELQIMSVTNPFMILSNTVGPNAVEAAGFNARLKVNSIPVCGLGSDCYGGLVFWDAEAWIALGLQLSHPKHIENVVNYRVEMYPQAKENIKMAFTSSKNQTRRFTGGAVFPWTSGRYGNCTAAGPCFDYEYHLNGAIGILFKNHLIATGDEKQFKEKFLPIMNDVAYFYYELLDFNNTSGFYEVWNATDPDEYTNNVNNPGFTTALIRMHLNDTNHFNDRFKRPRNETWNEVVHKMHLPINEEVGIVLEHGSMNGSALIKQADIVLIDDLLNWNYKYSLNNLDYYANKQSPDGPGMTYASYSIVANEISPSGCSSYTYDQYSSRPYARAPWYLYSEQMKDDPSTNGGTHPAFPFLTGMGGVNRIGIFGYLGVRMFYEYLDINPSLPPQISHLNYRTFYWHGWGINATSNRTHTTLQRMPDRVLDTANARFRDTIPVTLRNGNIMHPLTLDRPLIFHNRMPGQALTVKGNILQCKPLVPTPGQEWVPGQFPVAAIDGASSTKWQPEDPNRTNYLSVYVGPHAYGPIDRIWFDWGSAPPRFFEVLVSNQTVPVIPGSDVRQVVAGEVNISEPYDPSRLGDIVPLKGNQTNVTLPVGERVWSGEYVHLKVWGTFGNTSMGGEVAEWSVLLEERKDDGPGSDPGEL